MGGGEVGSRGGPGREFGELVDGGLGVLNEPVDGLAGTVVAKAVLDVIELDCSVGGEADAAVPKALGGAHLAVAVLAAGGPHNVASLNLHDLPDYAAPHPATVPWTRLRPLLLLMVVVVERKLVVAEAAMVVSLPHPLGKACILGGGSRGS